MTDQPNPNDPIKSNIDPAAPAPYDPKEVAKAKPEGADYNAEAIALCRHLKAKGVVLIVFDGVKGTGLSVQVTDQAVIREVPTILRRMAAKMEREVIWIDAKGEG